MSSKLYLRLLLDCKGQIYVTSVGEIHCGKVVGFLIVYSYWGDQYRVDTHVLCGKNPLMEMTHEKRDDDIPNPAWDIP